MATTVEEICPSEETLTQRESEASIQCPTPGCSRVFHNRPCLKMHLVKTHGVVANDEERGRYIRGQKTTVEKHYFCPVKHCVRGQGTKRPFPRMSQLKQHYMTVHAEKKNICSKCGKGFGLLDACRRHELKCGQLFNCSCGCPYTTLEALLTHARRQMHKVPECYQTKKHSTKPVIPATKSVALVVVNTADPVSQTREKNSGKKGRPGQQSIKPCLILPKPGPEGYSTRKVAKSVQTQTPLGMHSMHTQTPSCWPNAEQGCDTFTQTPSPTADQQFQFNTSADNLQLGLSQASVGTQVAIFANQCDFGVGTDDSFLAQLGCITGHPARQPFQYASNIPQDTQVEQLPPITTFVAQERSAFVSTNENSMQTLTIDPLCLNNQTQTNLTNADELRPLNSTQTQTCGLDQVPLEDNETQTLISLLGIDTANSIDSGTQTQHFLDDLFCAQDIELTESQTQTWLSDYPLTSPGLDSSGSDFVYKALDDLVDIHTQTSIVMSDFSELSGDTVFANSQTQTLQSDFGGYNVLSSSAQTDTHWAQVTQTVGQVSNGSLISTSCQTQT